ncbi:uncharacterized protein LACBIDRAFT_328455 [Laccaria bicolor S238N-H82]|uniref:Predicted protein n=1 Tax=Laccaria bicolor (strain S238N-H82 / ATCC MYA-4686) TaxID=486041 RepID=B0DEW1_LACBS|nr:uncharacterized protein LACBIDRAFT_328455 [Laccaria bicolor S238N-H82]EDR06743.1 predicted protein [Laccaria bicolor S238N-H82]|eukprot:XP_001882590.1 predicted protein [Laccaria bicolor S238N-H82]
MAPLHQPQDKQREKASDAIRVAWNAFQKETWENRGKGNGRNYVQMSPREREIIFREDARRRWRSFLKDHRMDAGAWIMTDTDEEEVGVLLGWNRDQMVDACEEEWGIFVVSAALYMCLHRADTFQNPAKLKPDMAQSFSGPPTQSIPGPPWVGRTQTIVQSQLPTRQSQLQDLHAPQPYAQPSGIKFPEHPVHAQAQRPIVQPRPPSARISQPRDSHASHAYIWQSGVQHSAPGQAPRPASARRSHFQDLRASEVYTWPSSVKLSKYPVHGQARLPRHSLGPSQMTQSRPSSVQSSRVPPPRQSRTYSDEGESDTSGDDDDEEEEGDISDGGETSGGDDDEEGEDSDDYDEEVDSDNPIEEDDEEERTNGVNNSTSGTPFSRTEPFFGEVSWAELKAKSPETALFAEQSAYAWAQKCHRKATRNNRSIAKYRLAGLAKMGVEELLILDVQEYGRMAHEKWVNAVNAEWERNLGRAQRVPEQTAVQNASNIQHAGEPLGAREGPQDNFRSGQVRDSRASSNPKTKDGRGGRVPKDIFKHLESFVRKRNVAGDEGESGPTHPDGRPTPKESPLTLETISQLDPVIGETSLLPPPAMHRNNTPVPSGSHPMHTKLDPVIGETSHRPPLTMHRSGTPVHFRSHPMHTSSAMWYDIDEEAIAPKEKTELKPWDSVPHEYERTEPHNVINSVRSSAFMLAEEGGEQYRQDDEETSYNEGESDWDSVISSESSINMTEASAHFTRSDQPRPSNIEQSAPRTVNAGGPNPDQPSVQRSAWRTTQSIPKSMMPADIRSKSSTTSTTAAGQQNPWISSQYTLAGALDGGINRPGAQRTVRMMQGLQRFGMFWGSPGFNNGDSNGRG